MVRKHPRITVKPFVFDDLQGVETRFRISKTEYTVRSIPNGYSVTANGEEFSIEYKKGTAKIHISDGKSAATVSYNYTKFPTVAIRVRANGKTATASGDQVAVGQKLRAASLTLPNPIAIRSLFCQNSVNAEFRYRLLSLLSPLVPYDDYHAFFRRQTQKPDTIEPGAGLGANPKSIYWCMLCAVAIADGIPGDEVVFCALCFACAVGPPA